MEIKNNDLELGAYERLIITNTATNSIRKIRLPLFELAAEGKLSELKKRIDLTQLDHKYQFGFTLLHYATKENRVEVIEYLVSIGCDINAADDDKQTPLHKSVMLGHTESVKLLIDKGANVNKVDNNGNTPLHVAIINGGDFCTVKALFEKANLAIQNNDDQNVLHVAVRHHKVDSINLILNHTQAPALITTADKDGLTPIHLAVSLGYFDTTEKLLKRPQMTIFGNTYKGKNIIHLAAATSNAVLLSLLLDSYNTLHLINEGDNTLCTPLHDAANKGQLKQVEILLDRGAMIKSTVDGFSPLHYACLQGYLSVVKILIDRHPFQSDLITHNKDTPLHLAARSGHAAIVKFLLDQGVLLTHNNQQASFLDLALFNRDYEVASAAVKHNRWQECLDFVSPTHPAPMTHLVQNIPEVAQIVMDHSITSAQLHPTDPSYWKHYDFKYIMDLPTDTADTKPPPRGLFSLIFCYLQFLFSLHNTYNAEPLNVIRTIIKYKRNKLFTHPLLITFLNLKWVKYGRLYIQIRAGILVLLTLLLTLLVGISDPPRSPMSTTEQHNCTTNLNISQYSDDNINKSHPLVIIILFTDSVYALLIILQVFFYIKLRKISHPVHFSFEVAAVVFTGVFLIGESPDWIPGIGALLCSWLALNLFSRYFDVFGLYTIMFYELLFKIVKVLLVGLYYIIGFGIILYILIGDQQLYDHPVKAVYAAFYAAISRLNTGILDESKNALQYPITTYITVLLFNIVLSITLINLLIGIAVRKTGAIQESALLYQAELKARLFLELDLLIPEFFQYKVFPKNHKIKGTGFNLTKIGGIWNRFTNFFAYNDDLQENDEASANQKKDHEIQEMMYRICQMEDQIASILKILTINSNNSKTT